MGVSQAELQARAAIVENCGFDVDDYRNWHAKYKTLCVNARNRGVECLLTFRQYLRLAARAGLTHPKDIGKSPSQYQMGRKGDTGDYVWGNCRFITMKQNLKERIKNGGSEVGASKASKTNRIRGVRAAMVHKDNAEVKPNSLQRPCVFVSPKGKKYQGPSLNHLCRRFDLDTGNMCKVLNGRQRQHRDWTGYYLEEQ